MRMREHFFLYSTNTWLGYVLAEQFYGGEHYVWCTPYFDSASLAKVDATTPPTSTPSEIYRSLDAEVCAGDRNSAKIEQNRVGILRGASIKRAAGVIDEQQERDIAAIVERAEIRDFRPLLFVIPFFLVAAALKPVPIEKRAHPLSVEYVIERLPRNHFEIIEFNWR